MRALSSLASYYAEMMSEVVPGGPAQLDTSRGRGSSIRDAVSLHDLVSMEQLRMASDGTLLISKPDSRSTLALGDDKPMPSGATAQAEDVGSDQDLAAEPEPSPAEQAWDRVRRVVGDVATNPYERELALAFPYLCGTGPNGGRVRAPLYTWRVEGDEDMLAGAIRLVGLESPALSPALTSLLSNDNPVVASKLREAILGISDYEPFEHLFELATLLARSTSVGDGFSGTSLEAPPTGGQGLRMVATCELLLASKSNYFVVNDLRELAKQDDGVPNGSILGAILDPAAFDEPFDETAEREAIESILATPFPSNASQRRILGRSTMPATKLLTVTGPPGTGKSQTIANLVCRLVARHQRVLVTSQKSKALEVVAQKLSELEIGYLALPLLGGDAAARQQLVEAIANLTDQTDGLLGPRLHEAWERYSTELADWDAERRYSFAVFEQLAQLERTVGPGVERYVAAADRDILGDVDTDAISPATAAAAVRRVTDELLVDQAAGDLLRAGPGLAQELADLVQIATLRVELLTGFPNSAIDTPLVDDADREMPCPILADLHRVLRRAAELTSRLPADLRPAAAELCDLDGGFGQATRAALHRVIDLASRLDPADRHLFGSTSVRPSILIAALKTWKDRGFPRYGIVPRTRRAVAVVKRADPDLVSHGGDEDVRRAGHWVKATETLDKITRDFDALPHGLHPLLGDLREGSTLDYNRALDNLGSLVELLDNLDAARATDLLTPSLPSLSDLDRLASAVAARLLAALTDALDAGLEPLPASQRELILSRELDTATHGVDRLTALHSAVAVLSNHQRQLLDLLGEELAAAAWSQIVAAVAAGSHTAATQDFDEAIELSRLRRDIARAEQKVPGTTAELVHELDDTLLEGQRLARKLLRVRNAQRLVGALKDPTVVRTVTQFRKAIAKGKRRYATFEELRQDLDYDALLRVFPAWIMGIDDVCRVFPLQAGLFDVVIIDEASQCHLANSLPLLHRAKRAIVVGDERQLPADTFRFLPEQRNQRAMEHHGVAALPRSSWFSIRDENLLSLAERCSGRPSEFLNEHFRSVPAIIAFANRSFYNDRLRVMTNPFAATLAPPLRIIQLDGTQDDPGSKVNKQEALAVVDCVQLLLEDPAYAGKSIGVISPYREQADEIQRRLVTTGIDPEARRRHKLVASTADGFQGDERDVIVYSFRFGPGSPPGVVTAIEAVHNAGPNRFNVAFTRAREQVITIISRPETEFPGILMRNWIEHARIGYRPPEAETIAFDAHQSRFEAEVAKALVSRGLTVYPQYPYLGFRIDLVVTDGGRRYLAVECDGYGIHTDEFGNQVIDDLLRQEILERAGWTVRRIPSRGWWRDPEKWLNSIVQTLHSLPEAQAATAAGEAARAAEGIDLHALGRVWDRVDEDGTASVRAAGTPRLRDVPVNLPDAERPEMRDHRDQEIASHLCEAIQAGRLSEDELIKATLSRLGFLRTGPALTRRVRSVMTGLIKSGHVRVTDNRYSCSMSPPKLEGQAATYPPVDLLDAMVASASPACSPGQLIERVAQHHRLLGPDNRVVLITILRYALASGRLLRAGEEVGTPESLTGHNQARASL